MQTDQYTIKEHTLKTSDNLHELYVQEWGNPDGAPVLFLHGGPGFGCDDGHKAQFDPAKHKVIFADQRGSGNSKPFASLENNTTDHLIQDIELIRQELGIAYWTIVGGSWGSTLALCYATKFPKHVSRMIIRGVFLGSGEEISWLYSGGTKEFFPEVWEKLLERTPPEFHDDPQSYHFKNIANSSGEEYKKSVYALLALDMTLGKLDTRVREVPYEDFDPETARVNQSYFIKDRKCYLPDNYILNNADKLKMPVTIIQGRYDMVCRPVIAYKLHKKLPKSSLIMTLAGHSGSDRNNIDATKATLAQL